MSGLIRGYTRHLTPVSPGAARTDPLDRGLVGEWRFDPHTGLILPDYSGYGKHGDLVGIPDWVTAQYGPALDFDGTNDAVDCGSGIFGTLTRVSWEVFGAAGAVGAHRSPCGDADNAAQGFTWFTIGGAGTRIHIWGATGKVEAEFAHAISSGWHHWICAYDSVAQNVKWYEDGVQILSQACNAGAITSSNTFHIGRWGLGLWDPRWDGQIALVKVYRRALSAAEVRARHQICLKRAQPMTHVWMMPWGKAPPVVGAALPIISAEAIHSLVFGGVTVR